MGWTIGDYYTNLQSLIEVSVESLAHHVPEINNARYDFETGTFRTSKGDTLTDDTLEKWSDSEARIRAAGAGRRTLKRGILFNTLLRAESERRSGLLERFIQQSNQLVKGDLSDPICDGLIGVWTIVGTIWRSALNHPRAIQSMVAEYRA